MSYHEDRKQILQRVFGTLLLIIVITPLYSVSIDSIFWRPRQQSNMLEISKTWSSTGCWALQCWWHRRTPSARGGRGGTSSCHAPVKVWCCQTFCKWPWNKSTRLKHFAIYLDSQLAEAEAIASKRSAHFWNRTSISSKGNYKKTKQQNHFSFDP